MLGDRLTYAWRFVATQHGFQGDDRDLRAMGGIKINICMGRDAGWLTAASTLGRRENSDDGPHLVYVPEVDFDPEEFVSSIEACMKRLGRCLVAVSEGIHDSNGELFLVSYAKQAGSNIAGMKDSHGNVSLGGTGVLGDALAGLVKEKLGNVRCRADTYGFLQRGFPADTSTVDAAEAAMVGAKAAVAAAGSEHTSGSIAIKRIEGPEVRTGNGGILRIHPHTTSDPRDACAKRNLTGATWCLLFSMPRRPLLCPSNRWPR